MKKIKVNTSFFIIILLFILAGGCAYLGMIPYPQTIQGQKQLLYGGKFNQATQRLTKEASGNNKILYLMEQGMIHNIQGDYRTSIEPFQQALAAIQSFEDRAVISARSVASQLLTLPTNDNAIPYRGYAFERVLLNTYQALNYFFLDDLEGARVEVRRADQRQTEELKRHNKQISEYQKWGKKRKIETADYPALQREKEKLQNLTGSVLNSFQNAFTYYLSGIIYELHGEDNDAYIDYKKTYQLSPHFSYVRKDLLRLSQKLGFREEYADWTSRFETISKEPKTGPHKEGAEVILFYGAGFIAQKEQIKLTLPINNTLISMALPVYTRQGVTRQGGNFLIKVFDAGRSLGNTSMVVDLDPLAVKALEEEFPIIFIRQMARILSKAALSKNIQKGSSNLSFLATSLYNILSENADLRNWLLLPNTIQVFRRYVPAGNHEFSWQLQTPSGTIQDVQKSSITLQKGDVCIVNLRSIENRLFSTAKILHSKK